MYTGFDGTVKSADDEDKPLLPAVAGGSSSSMASGASKAAVELDARRERFVV